MPFSITDAGATPLVVFAAVSEAARPPATVGLNVITAEQFPPAASVPVQLVELTAKSVAAVPETVSVSPANATPPGFVTVTVCPALATPTIVPAKLSVVGEILSEAGSTPVPFTGTATIGTPRLVLITDTVAFWLPPTIGAKITGTAHVPPAGSSAPHVPDPTLNGDKAVNSSPVKVPVPGLVTVSCIGVLFDPTVTGPKAN